MTVLAFRKETSERSDMQNWVLTELSASTFFYFVGFEGCNENNEHKVTTVMDRLSIELDSLDNADLSADEVLRIIKTNEGEHLIGKVKFCELLGFPYTYILYCYANEYVWRYEVGLDEIVLKQTYASFEEFSKWIQEIKGWRSNKDFRERQDLPKFDLALRKAGCPWPTNIDCVAFDREHNPIAMIEFQNTAKVGVIDHYNNAYYFPRRNNMTAGADEQRWRSQEILRVQSGLPHYTIVWSKSEEIIVIKKLECVTFPDYSDPQTYEEYITDLADYGEMLLEDPYNIKNSQYDKIRKMYSSYSLDYYLNNMNKESHLPPLDIKERTYPFIYGRRLGTYEKERVVRTIEEILTARP
ncbi:MAG: hypothetical protein IJ394_07895 [Bacteroidales bacterium]|nr:hypothetical protein [Bacteroidales bacterium]